jgi:hypothetical protein
MAFIGKKEKMAFTLVTREGGEEGLLREGILGRLVL